MARLRALVVAFFLVAALHTSTYARKWTDDTGQFSVEAEFVSESGDKVRLRKPDGRQIELPISRLSEADKKIIESMRSGKVNDPFTNVVESSGQPTHIKSEQTIVAEGLGSTADEALKDAFRNAVRQVVGALVSAETIVKNDTLIDEMLTYSDGFVKQYELVAGSKKVQNGLHHIKITAQVQRRSVIAKLKSKNIRVNEVDGKGLFAEVVTQQDADSDASALVAKAFATYPALVIDAVVKDKPAVIREGGHTTLAYCLTISVDVKKYDAFCKQTLDVLRKLARQKGECFVVSGAREGWSPVSTFVDQHEWQPQKWLSMPFNYEDRSGFGKSWWKGRLSKADDIVLVMNTKRSSLNDRTTWEWFHLPRPDGSEEEGRLRIGATFDKDVRVDVVFDDAMGDEVLRDSLILPTVPRGSHPTPGISVNSNGFSGNHDQVPIAILSPYVFDGDSRSYSQALSALRKIPIAADDLKRITTINTNVTEDVKEVKHR